MHDALTSSIARWKQRLLITIDTFTGVKGNIDGSRLAKALADVSTWEGCPRADDLAEGRSAIAYRRFPLTLQTSRNYEALLILWPPDHATPIHDHDGLWGMEFVLDGVLEVEAFDLSLNQHPHLVSREASILGVGDFVTFSDADYAHRCKNLSSNRPALSLHIYGGELNTYRSFHEEDDHWTVTQHQTVRDPALS